MFHLFVWFFLPGVRGFTGCSSLGDQDCQGPNEEEMFCFIFPMGRNGSQWMDAPLARTLKSWFQLLTNWASKSSWPGGPRHSWGTGTISVESLDAGTLFPQIAGSYRGSYFSKVGLLITEIAAAPSLPSSFVSFHLSPCMLITEIAAAPSLPSSFVSLHLSPCMLITEIAAAPSLPSSFVSLHADYRNRCRS